MLFRHDHYLVKDQRYIRSETSHSRYAVNLCGIFWRLRCYANYDTAVRDYPRRQVGVYWELISLQNHLPSISRCRSRGLLLIGVDYSLRDGAQREVSCTSCTTGCIDGTW